jgi:hypothetical protein
MERGGMMRGYDTATEESGVGATDKKQKMQAQQNKDKVQSVFIAHPSDKNKNVVRVGHLKFHTRGPATPVGD